MPWFTLELDELVTGDQVVARHKNNVWEYKGHRHTVLSVQSPCRVASDAGAEGRFDKLRVVDGYVQTGEGNPLARFDEAAQVWFMYSSGKYSNSDHRSRLAVPPVNGAKVSAILSRRAAFLRS